MGLSGNPQLHAAVYQDVRKAVVRRFPCVVLYREESGEVVIISAFHTARGPSICGSQGADHSRPAPCAGRGMTRSRKSACAAVEAIPEAHV